MAPVDQFEERALEASLQEAHYWGTKFKNKSDTIITACERVAKVSTVRCRASASEEFNGDQTLLEILKAAELLQDYAAQENSPIPGMDAASSIDDIVGEIVASGLFGGLAKPIQPEVSSSRASSFVVGARRLMEKPARRRRWQQLEASSVGTR